MAQQISKGKNRKQNLEECLKGKVAKFKSYQMIAIQGSRSNIEINITNLMFPQRLWLYLKSRVLHNPIEVKLGMITILWIPLVEPSFSSYITMELDYLLARDITDENNESIVKARGKISEQIAIHIYPTKPVVFRKNGDIKLPWNCSVDFDEITQDKHSGNLGFLKIWCPTQVTSITDDNHRVKDLLYKLPTVEWSNKHFPYYLPFYCIKNVNSIEMIDWKNTPQYLEFEKDVLNHTNPEVLPSHQYLMMMQLLSINDCYVISNITEKCEMYKSKNYCSCGHKVSTYIHQKTLSVPGKYMTHQQEFDNINKSIIEGKLSTIDISLPKF